jgi:hypothetical protein
MREAARKSALLRGALPIASPAEWLPEPEPVADFIGNSLQLMDEIRPSFGLGCQ